MEDKFITFGHFNDDTTTKVSIKIDLNDCHNHVAKAVSEFMNATTSFHKLHLKIKGDGSYSAHKALNKLYDALPNHADDLAEGYQGATESLLSYEDEAPRCLNSVNEALAYCNELKDMISKLQGMIQYSEINNDLDNVKSTINSIKYKLLFLK
jgi:DNA-binding ferritin-like protein